MAIKVGLSEEVLQAGYLMYTIPSNSSIDAQIIVDLDHVIYGEFCHLKKGDEERVWAYTGDKDPCHSMGIDPRFSVVVPAVVKEKGKKVVRYIRGSKQFQRQLLSLNSRFESILGLRVKFTRKDGDWTRYSIDPTGKFASTDEYDQDDILESFMENVFQGTPQEVMDWLGASAPAINLSDFDSEEI